MDPTYALLAGGVLVLVGALWTGAAAYAGWWARGRELAAERRREKAEDALAEDDHAEAVAKAEAEARARRAAEADSEALAAATLALGPDRPGTGRLLVPRAPDDRDPDSDPTAGGPASGSDRPRPRRVGPRRRPGIHDRGPRRMVDPPD